MPNGDKRHVSLASRCVNKAKANYAHLEQEALSIILDICKFHHYLHGQSFSLLKDHCPLITILPPHKKEMPSLTSSQIQRLSGHTFSMVYPKADARGNASTVVYYSYHSLSQNQSYIKRHFLFQPDTRCANFS